MSIADVFNTPTTDDELAWWATLHMILHRDQNLAVLRQKNIILPEFVLDPVDTNPNSGWFQNHQLMHNNIDQILDVAQFDLTDVDWRQEPARIGWFQGHAQLHRLESDALGVFS